MRQFAPVLNVVAFVMMLFSLTMCVPLLGAWWYHDGQIDTFLFAILLSFTMGAVTWLLTRRYKRELQARDGFLLVVLVWAMLPLIAMLPYLIYYDSIGKYLSFADAYFEAMSGITTTGATTLDGLDNLPPSINIWRGTLIWFGGMGILVLAVAILPLLGVGGQQLFKAETPGPMKDDRLTPRITQTARGLYAIYFTASMLCMLAYHFAGMSWLDAYCHMGATMALGGLSTHDAGFAWFDSVSIEIIGMVFMIFAGINFATHFAVIRSRSLKTYFTCPEAKWYVLIILTAGMLISCLLFFSGTYSSFMEALRYGMFNTISVSTTTAFSTQNWTTWPVFSPMLMLLLSSFVASSGSTGGGVKLIRTIIMLKHARRELIRLIHPRGVYHVRVADRVIPNKVVFAVMAFFMMYGMSVTLITFVLLLTGLDVQTSLSAAVVTINSMGAGFGLIDPSHNYSSFTDIQVIVCAFAMLIGRLELFTVLVLFTPTFWRK